MYRPNQGNNNSNNNNNNNSGRPAARSSAIVDRGPNMFAANLAEIAINNVNFRTTVWTGGFLQLTVMSIPVGSEIGLEQHADLDQFLYIQEGRGVVLMGPSRERFDLRQSVGEGYGLIIPAGTWHNLVNTGKQPLKLYSIYAPPAHASGTVHKTKAESDAEEHAY